MTTRPVSAGAGPSGVATMDVLYPCCAGLDVHKDSVYACVRRVGPGGAVRETVLSAVNLDRVPFATRPAVYLGSAGRGCSPAVLGAGSE